MNNEKRTFKLLDLGFEFELYGKSIKERNYFYMYYNKQQYQTTDIRFYISEVLYFNNSHQTFDYYFEISTQEHTTPHRELGDIKMPKPQRYSVPISIEVLEGIKEITDYLGWQEDKGDIDDNN